MSFDFSLERIAASVLNLSATAALKVTNGHVCLTNQVFVGEAENLEFKKILNVSQMLLAVGYP